MPDDKNGKRDTQRTEKGYEIPVPGRKEVFDALNKAAKKRDTTTEAKSKRGRRSK